MLIASGQAEHRPPLGASVIVIAVATVGVDLGTKRLAVRLNHPVLLFFSPQVEKKNGCCVHWTTTNPATTAALICSCLTISAITIVSGLLRVLKSAQLTCNSSLQAQKFLHHRGQSQLPRTTQSRMTCFCHALPVLCQGTSAIFQPYHPYDQRPWTQ
jgi:hypothetical protein